MMRIYIRSIWNTNLGMHGHINILSESIHINRLREASNKNKTSKLWIRVPLIPGIGIGIGMGPILIPVSVSVSVWHNQYRYRYESSAWYRYRYECSV